VSETQRYTAEQIIQMGQDDDDGDPPGKGKKLFIILALLLILAAAAGAYFSGLADPLLAMLTGDESASTEGEATKDESIGAAIFYDLPDMLVNLNVPGQKKNFLKVKISLELLNAGDIASVELVLPRIEDHLQVYLREMRLQDLEGRAGMNRLRVELLKRINIAMRPVEVRDVLFREMIIQ
jgi:flagellar protein FliL